VSPLEAAPSVSLTEASIFYHENDPIFSNLRLHLPAKKWTGLLGRSGVGKSSLLRLLAGLIDSRQSTCRIQLSDHGTLFSRVTYLSQNDNLLPWLNLLDNVLIGFRLRGEKNKRVDLKDKAIALFTRVGLKDFVFKRPCQLSGGQRQRVVLVRTFMENRPVILMDEPFSSLDLVTSFALQSLAVELFKEHTVLLVTHNPLEALRVCHQICVMSGTPAYLVRELELTTPPPRDLEDSTLLALQAKLLVALQSSCENFTS